VKVSLNQITFGHKISEWKILQQIIGCKIPGRNLKKFSIIVRCDFWSDSVSYLMYSSSYFE